MPVKNDKLSYYRKNKMKRPLDQVRIMDNQRIYEYARLRISRPTINRN